MQLKFTERTPEVASSEDPRLALARRLKGLREENWPGEGLTQLQLAQALGGERALSISLISSWESPLKPVAPPLNRLHAYATFFATRRSVEQEPFRVLSATQLTEEERTRRDELLRELKGLRKAAREAPTARATTGFDAGFWHFPDQNIVTIICAQLPEELRMSVSYTDPTSPDYIELYRFADLDAMVELYGHLRAVNPTIRVNYTTAGDLTPDDYTSHLVLLGGVDWNVVTRDLLDRLELPVSQVARHDESEVGGFEVPEGGRPQLFAPQLDENGRLVEDIAHFYRGLNPLNKKRTVTICNGMYGRGTLGAVRALTDVRFRDRNTAYLKNRFPGADAFSIISRVPVVTGQVVTPDWTNADTRLHEWAGENE
jgi:transcriptional regulator with XRE-family HTH domain